MQALKEAGARQCRGTKILDGAHALEGGLVELWSGSRGRECTSSRNSLGSEPHKWPPREVFLGAVHTATEGVSEQQSWKSSPAISTQSREIPSQSPGKSSFCTYGSKNWI